MHLTDQAGQLIELATSSLQVVLDPLRGGQIVHIGRPGGANVLFHEDWSTPLKATAAAGYGAGALDWLSHYRGGWQVMFPNAGAACLVDDVPLPLHGEVSTAPQAVLAVDSSSVRLESGTRRPLRLRRHIWLDPARPVLHIEEQAINDATWPMPFAHGHHPAFQVSAGSIIDLPAGPLEVDADFSAPEADLPRGAQGMWPLIRGSDGSMTDLSRVPAGPVERVCYLADRPGGWAALRDPASGTGVAMAWDVEAFPHLWLWQQIGGRRFPFFGRARIVALEPVSTWPADGLAAAIERGQASYAVEGAPEVAWISLSLFTATDTPVVGVERDGHVRLALR